MIKFRLKHIAQCFAITVCCFPSYCISQSNIAGKFFIGPAQTGPSIYSLYKSNVGFIYAGTSDGLFRFDGFKFKKIPFSGKNVSDTVTAIYEDKQARWWLGFKSGRLANLINDRVTYLNPEEGTPAKKINNFLEDKNQNLWFSSYGEGLYVMNNNRQYLFNEEDGLSDKTIHDLALANSNEVLAATDQGVNICSFINGEKKVTTIGPAEGLPDYLVFAIADAGAGKFWLGTESQGPCLYNHHEKKVTTLPGITAWPYGAIYEMVVVNENLWMATSDGLVQYNTATGNLLPFSGRPKQPITRMIVDNQLNLWLNNDDNSVSRISPDLIKIYPAYDSRAYSEIHTVLKAGNNKIYTNATHGLYQYDLSAPDIIKNFIPLQSLPGITPVTSLFQDNNGIIWIGTLGKGLMIYNPSTKQQRVITENPVLKNASILSLTGNANEVMVSSLEGCAVFKILSMGEAFNATYSYINFSREQTGTNYVYQVFKDSKDRYWFATDGMGLILNDHNKVRRFDTGSGLADDHIYAVTEDSEGNIWFSTGNAGIYKYDGSVFTNYNENSGLSNLEISAIHADPQGNILVINSAGVDVIRKGTNEIFYINSAYGLTNINAKDLQASSMDANGHLWLSSSTGFAAVHIPSGSLQKPWTVIESVELFLQDIEDKENTRFSYDENNFTFSYVGLYYTNPAAVQYRYMLEGLDTNWVVTSDRVKTFPRLAPGQYRFRIQSSLQNNFINASEASWSFTIQKPFYYTAWFILLVTAIAIIIIYLIVRIRERNLKKLQQLHDEKLQSKFEILKNQVNPHFLFNSFNTLISSIEENPAAAVAYTEQLSDFFRHIVTYRDKDLIPLSEELKVMETYFFLQQQRYGKAIQLDINITEKEAETYLAPPLSLQLLVENAMKHNAILETTPLHISIFTKDGMLAVKNNKVQKTSKSKSTGLGLANIKNRFALLCDTPVQVTENENSFLVLLPLIRKTSV